MSKKAHTLREVTEAGGPGHTTLWEDINAGRLRARRMGRKVIILDEDFEAYLASLPVIEPKAAA